MEGWDGKSRRIAKQNTYKEGKWGKEGGGLSEVAKGMLNGEGKTAGVEEGKKGYALGASITFNIRNRSIIGSSE